MSVMTDEVDYDCTSVHWVICETRAPERTVGEEEVAQVVT